jgi:flagellar motor switch protein FliM
MSDRLMEQGHALSQEDIDALFKSQAAKPGGTAPRFTAQPYDFRRSDRIPKEQIRALRVVHDTFARSLASSLSAYLRTYVTVNLISVEQLSFREFTACLPSPTCLAVLRLSPMEGSAILELNPSLAFPLIEVMLGGGKVKPVVVEREMTSIEQQIFDSLLVLILQNLSVSWQSVSKVSFAVESHETEPALLQVFPPNEAIVVIATEIQLAETSGMMNIGIPSSVVKLLRQRFDQQWTARRASSNEEDEGRVLKLIGGAFVDLDAQVSGSTVTLYDLLQLEEGDVLQFERAASEPSVVYVNGIPKLNGRVVMSGRRKAVEIQDSVAT